MSNHVREAELTPGEFYTIGKNGGSREIVTFIRIEENGARVIPHTGGPLKHGEPVTIDFVSPTTLEPLASLISQN